MDQVFLKARELASALMESDAFQTMREAEKHAMQDADASGILGMYMEKRHEIEELLAKDNADSEEIKARSEEMDALQEVLQANEAIQAMTSARADFTSLLEQVNQVLRFMITGQVTDDEEDGCTGSCESCGGCHHHLN